MSRSIRIPAELRLKNRHPISHFDAEGDTNRETQEGGYITYIGTHAPELNIANTSIVMSLMCGIIFKP
jgi:hypothetical protein